jgi:hypothetical protein
LDNCQEGGTIISLSARREARRDCPNGFPGKMFRHWTERDDFREITATIVGPSTTTLGAAIEESSQLRDSQALENSRWRRKIVKALGGKLEVLAKFPR